MENLTHYPVLVFAMAFLSLSLASAVSGRLRRRNSGMNEELKDDLSLILAASLTLLALIIGFSFSMAIDRYDQRKSFEEAEANAIGTEYLRADLLPSDDAARVRKLLRDYTNLRVLFYTDADDAQRRESTNKSVIGGRSLGLGPRTGFDAGDAGCRPGARWHERCYQLSGPCPGGLLEPDSCGRLVSHGGHCAVL